MQVDVDAVLGQKSASDADLRRLVLEPRGAQPLDVRVLVLLHPHRRADRAVGQQGRLDARAAQDDVVAECCRPAPSPNHVRVLCLQRSHNGAPVAELGMSVNGHVLTKIYRMGGSSHPWTTGDRVALLVGLTGADVFYDNFVITGDCKGRPADAEAASVRLARSRAPSRYRADRAAVRLSRGEQRAEHRVGAVPVRPQLHGRAVAEVGHAGERGDARRRRSWPATIVERSRPGAASRSRSRPRRRDGRGAARRRAARAAARPAPATSAGVAPPARLGPAPQRAQAGARRVEQHPVVAAVASGEVARVADAAPRPATPRWPGGPARPGAGAARWRSRRRRARRGQRGEQRGLAARAGAQVEPALVAARRAARSASAERAQLAALVLHAGACVAHARRARRGRRRSSRTAYGDQRPAVPPASASSSSRAIRPGQATRWVRGPLVVGGQRRAGLVERAVAASPSASANAATIHSGWAVRSASRPSGDASRPSRSVHSSQLARGDRAQHRVDEPGGAARCRWRGPDRRWSRPRRARGMRVRSTW